jgi:hypothetical protein
MLKIALTPRHLGDYESRMKGARWCIVRLSDGARFVCTCQKRGWVTSDWGYQVGAESWIRVLHDPFYAEQVARNVTWLPASQADADDVPAAKPDEAEPDDELDASSLASAEWSGVFAIEAQ